MNRELLRQRLIDGYDPDGIVDILDISSEELLDRFEDKLDEYIEKLEDKDDDDSEGEDNFPI